MVKYTQKSFEKEPLFIAIWAVWEISFDGMEINMKKDWNQFQEAMTQFSNEKRYSASCQIWNNDMTDILNKYKQEEVAWYNSPQATENGFMTTTQNLWYTHYLNKKRLAALGLTAHYDYIKPTDYVKDENRRYPYWDYSHDGKNLICKISDEMVYRKAFYDRNRCVWSDERRKSPGEYYLIQSRSMNGNYACPNCGWESALEHFVDGCDYCQTKFQIEDLKQKVSSVYNPGDWTQRRDGFTIYKNFVPMYVILVIFIIVLLAIGINMGGAMTALTPLLGLGAIILFVMLFVGKKSKESVAEGPAKTRQTLETIRSVDKHFSVENLIGNLSNKLLSICYADSAAEIAPFAVCDMAALLPRYRGVIDCKLLECVLMDYRKDNTFQHLQVKVGMMLTKYENGGVRQEKAYLKLKLVKSIRALTQSINDVNVYRCDSCGASLSLLNGGKCEYCGQGLDLKEYDWVIEGYE